MSDVVRLSTALPTGWYCKSVSVSGFGVYQKTYKPVRPTTHGYASTHWIAWRHFTVSFNGFMGGWVACEESDGYLFNGNPFPSYMAAIVAVEVELANQAS